MSEYYDDDAEVDYQSSSDAIVGEIHNLKSSLSEVTAELSIISDSITKLTEAVLEVKGSIDELSESAGVVDNLQSSIDGIFVDYMQEVTQSIKEGFGYLSGCMLASALIIIAAFKWFI